MLNSGLVDSEESTSDKDLFSNINSSPSITNQHGADTSTDITPGITADDATDMGTDADTDSDGGGEAEFDGVPLDVHSEDEGECGSSEDEVQGVGAMAEGVTADEMDFDEGIKVPESPGEAYEPVSPF